METVYQYPWEKIKPQLLAWVKQGILDPDTCNFTVIYGTKRYTVNSWEEFYNLKAEELVLINKMSLETAGLFSGKDTLKEILQVARERGKTALLKRLEQ